MHSFSDTGASHTTKILQNHSDCCKNQPLHFAKISVSLNDLEKLNWSSSFKTLHWLRYFKRFEIFQVVLLFVVALQTYGPCGVYSNLNSAAWPTGCKGFMCSEVLKMQKLRTGVTVSQYWPSSTRLTCSETGSDSSAQGYGIARALVVGHNTFKMKLL